MGIYRKVGAVAALTLATLVLGCSKPASAAPSTGAASGSSYYLNRMKNAADCNGSNDDLIISGCTGLLHLDLPPDMMTTVTFQRANAYYDKGLYQDAIVGYTFVILTRPDFVAAYTNRAVAYSTTHDDPDAIADAKKAVALAPTAIHLQLLAKLYQQSGQRNAAIANYRAALKIDPNEKVSRQRLKDLGVTP